MNDILKTYMERFRENRHTLRRYTAFVLALAMITTLFVNWQLHGVGISMTAQYQCGEEEHIHTADCYTKVLTCGYEEGELENADEVAAAAATSQPTVEAEPAPLALEPQIEFVPHEHTEDCYTEVQTLTCMEEEHVHGDDCFDPEDGTLICEKFEHTHDENCYTTEYELTCGLEEGELVEQVVEPTQSAELAAMAVAEPVALEPTVDTVEPIYHHHTDACYEEVLTCPLPEHHHTVACLSDTSADVETPEEWQAANDEAVMTGNWDEDLLSVAKTQLGYEQSEKNFEIDPADGVTLHYYSRYGQSYGNPYGEWDVMFLSYCLKYAGIPQSAIPQEASVLSLRSSMSDMDWLLDGEDGSAANVGDIVIYNKYVTRTVAVDSSADGAADDLDDQFSMDAEGENGAALETSGASALDAAPAAEDAPAADSVITPDLPDTANPEQPAAKPVDSTSTSASGADTLIPSVVSPAAEPQTTTVTDAQPVETVGIVSEADDDTLTVISGDVDGKVAEVTLSNAEVLAVVDVAAAQYADEMLSSAVDGALKAPDMLSLTGEDTTASTTTTPKYIDYFAETSTSQKGGITSITIQKGTATLNPNDKIELKDGEKLSLTYTYSIPEGALTDSKTLTYQLPTGITPFEEKTFPVVDTNNGNKTVGEGKVDSKGKVTLKFDDSFETDKPFAGHFDFDVTASVTGSGDSSTIRFPTEWELTVKRARDLSIKKQGATPVVENGITYIDYTIIVSSEDGWSEKIEIMDVLGNNDDISGTYLKDSFKLYKNGNSDPITGYKNDISTDSFHITDLNPLGAGESYKLTYRVKVTQNKNDTVVLQNKARTNKENDWSYWETKFENPISKYGNYNPDTNQIKWTVTVKNPYGQNLKDSKVVDKVTTSGATIVGNVTLTQTSTPEGEWSNTVITNSIAPYEDGTGFEYTFGDANGKEYQFTYVTSVPKDSNGKPQVVHNDSKITINKKKDYSTGADTYPTDRSWYFNKNKVENSLTSTETENQYLAKWSLSSEVPNFWDTYDFLDQIKVPKEDGTEIGKHYGIASELDAAIRESLTFTTVNGVPLNAKDAGIEVTIDYYEESFKDPSKATRYNKISASDSDTKIHTFIIHLKNTGYSGTSPIKSMNIGCYSTHVDTTGIPAGKQVNFYNNDTCYSYKKDVVVEKKALTKGVSTNSPKQESEYNNNTNSYKATAEGSYSQNKGIYYELVLDVSKWTTFKNKDGEYTVTVTDTLPDGLALKANTVKAYLGWDKYCQDHDSNLKYYLNKPDNFSYECNGQNITFTFNNLDQVDYELVKPAGRMTHLIIRYAANLTDEDWQRPQTTTKPYTNTAKWGKEEAEATITINRNFKYLSKVGSYEQLKTNGKENGQHVVHYKLEINPTYSDLLPSSDTVTLTDTLTVQDVNVTAHLDLDSVKLYDYPYSGSGGTPLDTTSYGLVYTQGKDGSNYDTHTMTFTLPDSHGYVLCYDYVLDSNAAVTLSNKAELAGEHKAEDNENTTRVNGTATASQSQFKLYKVDSLNPLTRLQGAKFNLFYYDGTTRTYKEYLEQFTHTTDAKGEIVLYLGDNKKDDPSGGHFTIEPDTLYKLEELDPPEGYQKSADATAYVIFANANIYESAENALKNTAIPNDLDQSKVVIVTSGQQKSYAVENTRTWLTIQKFWQDQYGNTISSDAAPETEVTVHLYRYSKNGGSKENRDATFDVPIILNKNNEWTYVYKESLDTGYYYYIVEDSTGNKYEVTYSDSNTKGVENGGLLTLTNKEKDIPGYELPSTGGTGTLPYTAVGGTMMLTALAYSFIHRKRRREGRADD